MYSRHMLEKVLVPAALAFALTACDGRTPDTRTEFAESPTTIDTGRAAPNVGDVALQLVVAPTGNAARYRIREQLVRVALPNDAVGETSDVTGGIALDAAGNVVPAASKFTVDAAALKSDRDRRDNYVRSRILETEQHPTVELAPTAVRGLTVPLPTSGTKTLELLADLTVHGVTRPTTWSVDARFQGDTVRGSASTSFTFAEFGLPQPRVPIVLSVSDTIKLEYDFTLVPKR